MSNKDFECRKQTFYRVYDISGAYLGVIDLIIDKYVFKPIGYVAFYDSKDLKGIIKFLDKFNKEHIERKQDEKEARRKNKKIIEEGLNYDKNNLPIR